MTHPGELLSAFLDGEIDHSERAAVTEHLAVCEACRWELDGLAHARAALRALPMLDAPLGLVGDEPAGQVRRFPTRPLAWAAAAMAAGLLAVGMVTGGEQAPVFDLDTLSEHHAARVVVDPGIVTIRATVGGP